MKIKLRQLKSLIREAISSAPIPGSRLKIGDHVNVKDYHGDSYRDAVIINFVDDVQEERGHSPVTGPGFTARVHEAPYDMVFSFDEIDTSSAPSPPSSRQRH